MEIIKYINNRKSVATISFHPLYHRRQKDGVTSIVFSAFINTAIIQVNNYSKCECWLQIPPVVCYGRDAFTHQIWMKWMLMCSIIVLNHGHQWGWVEHVYCCCSAGSTDKASLLKIVELLQYFGTNTEVLCLWFANEVARVSFFFFFFSPFPLPVFLARDPTYGPTQGFSQFFGVFLMVCLGISLWVFGNHWETVLIVTEAI